MAQSYEEVRRQAKEYELQLQEIKAREIDQEIEDFKQSEEYNEFNKFFETYDPEKYRIATALFLDLVYQEINGYNYQKEPNERAADMLNAYEKSMSRYLSEKFSPEDLIVKKKEEIIEVVQSFPKKDIKDSKRDTKETNEERPIKTNRNKVTKRKPRQRKASKAFPRVVARNPKRKTKRTKVKPRRKQIATNKVNTSSKNNVNNDVPVEYENPMVSINEMIGYNGQPLKYDEQPSTKERKYFGIKNNREYMELKNEIDQFTHKEKKEVIFTEFSKDGRLSYEEGDEYYLEREMDIMDAHLFSNQKPLKSSKLEEKNYTRKLKDESLKNYINTENYTKVNQLISALSNQELELRNKHKNNQKQIDELSFFDNRNSVNNYANTIKYLEDTNLSYRDEIKKIKRQINELLKIRQTMKEYKTDDVEYKRTPSSRKIVTDPNFIKEIEKDNIIYLSYQDFITQKEIKAIIDYNNRKRKK